MIYYDFLFYFIRLNPLNIGRYCVLKSNTRLLSGADMEDRSMMLEHTLVLSGDSVDSATVWQGTTFLCVIKG